MALKPSVVRAAKQISWGAVRDPSSPPPRPNRASWVVTILSGDWFPP